MRILLTFAESHYDQRRSTEAIAPRWIRRGWIGAIAALWLIFGAAPAFCGSRKIQFTSVPSGAHVTIEATNPPSAPAVIEVTNPPAARAKIEATKQSCTTPCDLIFDDDFFKADGGLEASWRYLDQPLVAIFTKEGFQRKEVQLTKGPKSWNRGDPGTQHHIRYFYMDPKQKSFQGALLEETDFVRVGSERLERREYAGAVQAFKTAIERNPNAKAYSLLGQSYMGLKDFSQAIDAYERALGIDANLSEERGRLAEAHFNLGKAYLDQMDLVSAEGQAQALKSIDQVKAAQLFADLGAGYLGRKDFGNARQQAEALKSVDQGKAIQLFEEVGKVYLAVGDLENAQRQADALKSLDRERAAKLFYDVGGAYLIQGNLDSAQKEAETLQSVSGERAADLFEKVGKGYLARADLVNAQRQADAFKSLDRERAAKLSYEVGEAYLIQENLDAAQKRAEALKSINQEIAGKLFTKVGEARLARGKAYVAQNDLANARKQAEALESMGDLKSAAVLRGVIAHANVSK